MAIFQKIINSFVFVFAAVASVFWGVAAYTVVFEIIKDYENFPALYINLIILFLIVPFLIFKCLSFLKKKQMKIILIILCGV